MFEVNEGNGRGWSEFGRVFVFWGRRLDTAYYPSTPVVYMGRNKNGQTKRGVRGRVQFFVKFCFVPAVGPGGFALGYSSVQFSSALDRGLGFMSSLS